MAVLPEPLNFLKKHEIIVVLLHAGRRTPIPVRKNKKVDNEPDVQDETDLPEKPDSLSILILQKYCIPFKTDLKCKPFFIF